MRFLGGWALFLAVMLLAVPGFAQDPLLGEAGPGWETDDIPTLWYNPEATTLEDGTQVPAGILQVFAARIGGDGAAKVNMTSLNVGSDPGLFVSGIDKTAVTQLPDAFDNFNENNLFKATFGGAFNDVLFTQKDGSGGVMNAGLSAADILAAFTTTGSLEGGGGLPRMDLVVVPEPSAFALLALGLAGLLAWRRR